MDGIFLVFYILAIILAVGFMWLGIKNQSFAFAYFGMFTFLLVGILILQFGVDIPTGFTVTGTEFGNVNASAPIVGTDTYTTFTSENNAIVLLFGNLLFYGAFGLLVPSTYFAFRKGEDETW